MRSSNQDNVCEFVRKIVATRIGEAITLTSRPDRDHRDIQAVEELWESAHHQFAVEHTLLRSFLGGELDFLPHDGESRRKLLKAVQAHGEETANAMERVRGAQSTPSADKGAQ